MASVSSMASMSSMASVSKASIAIVDDHPLFRQGLVAALRHELDLEVIGEAGDAASALELVRTHELDVAVVDVLMPEMSGISLATEIFELRPRCKILGLSVVDDPGLIADMLRARACGFATKSQSVAEIVGAIRQVLGGLRYLPPGVARAAVEIELARAELDPLQRLTRREREVFELVIRGHTNDEIATQLFISRRTVETHRQRIGKKLSAHSIVQLQRLAARHGGLGS
jgi:DNA-binding NarL/FixJ family response regulator